MIIIRSFCQLSESPLSPQAHPVTLKTTRQTKKNLYPWEGNMGTSSMVHGPSAAIILQAGVEVTMVMMINAHVSIWSDPFHTNIGILESILIQSSRLCPASLFCAVWLRQLVWPLQSHQALIQTLFPYGLTPQSCSYWLCAKFIHSFWLDEDKLSPSRVKKLSSVLK